jgi:hypothetical protein
LDPESNAVLSVAVPPVSYPVFHPQSILSKVSDSDISYLLSVAELPVKDPHSVPPPFGGAVEDPQLCLLFTFPTLGRLQLGPSLIQEDLDSVALHCCNVKTECVKQQQQQQQ